VIAMLLLLDALAVAQKLLQYSNSYGAIFDRMKVEEGPFICTPLFSDRIGRFLKSLILRRNARKTKKPPLCKGGFEWMMKGSNLRPAD
jgi:hypothetical protein